MTSYRDDEANIDAAGMRKQYDAVVAEQKRLIGNIMLAIDRATEGLSGRDRRAASERVRHNFAGELAALDQRLMEMRAVARVKAAARDEEPA